MPLYEYRCENCGEVFEVMQKFSDEPLAIHAKCGGNVQRLLSPPALQFKGSGWYVNDYARAAESGKTADSGKSADSGNGAPKADAPAASKSGAESSGGAPSTASSASETKTKTESSSDKK